MFSDIVEYCKNVREWLDADPENVIAVHCKGGKGRTGTMICVWLVDCGIFEEAKVTTEKDYVWGSVSHTNNFTI